MGAADPKYLNVFPFMKKGLLVSTAVHLIGSKRVVSGSTTLIYSINPFKTAVPFWGQTT